MKRGPRSVVFPALEAARGGVIAPDERLPAAQTVALGMQHVVAMFGATVLAPLLMGFDPNVAILFSGIGTLIFFVAVGGRVPSYLGSSFSFIAVVIAATGYAGGGPNANLGVALGGIVAAGIVYTVIGLAVMKVGYALDRNADAARGHRRGRRGDRLEPRAHRGERDRGQHVRYVDRHRDDRRRGPRGRPRGGLARRLPILLGGLAGYALYAILTNGFGLAKPIDFTTVANAAWLGLPKLAFPVWNTQAIALIAPVAIVLVAENLGHVKAVAAMTGQNLDRYLGRAFLGDGLATIVAGAGGGTGVTTYAENIGVMAVTKIYSTLVFVVAALTAIVLGFSPKFGALIMTIPGPVLGGLAIVVFGLITATGARIWVQNAVDFSRARNLVTVAVTLTVGAGDLALKIGGFSLGGIGTATFGAILLYQLLGDDRPESPT